MERAREALLETRGLNLGSGTHYAEGWVNVDLWDPGDPYRAPDVQVSVFDLAREFPEDSFGACYLGHFLEHLEWNAIPTAIEEIRAVCRPGATVMAVGPCILRAVATSQPVEILTAILADPRMERNGAGHAWTPTEELTREALERGGLLDVTTVPIVGVTKPTWPNPTTAPWQTAAMGTVP